MYSSLLGSRRSRNRAEATFGLLILSLVWVIPVLACGSFQPRDSSALPTEQLEQSTADSSQSANSESSDDETSSTGGVTETTPLPEVPTATPEPLPTPTFTTTPVPGTALIVGQPARIVAPNGLNMRQSATASSQLVLQLGTGQLVDITAGPSSADGYVWWQVVDQQGNQGWVAEGDSETVWLSPSVGAPQAVSRPPQVGDRVRVTMESGLQLTLRALPGTDGPLVTRVNPGTEFTVLNGPQRANGFSWYQIRSDNGTILGWAAASDAQGQDRWLSPIE